MRICAFWKARDTDNPARHPLRAAMESRGWTIRDTHSRKDLAEKIVQAAADGFHRLVIAGGDGTLHVAVNALAKSPKKIPLAVLPLGTGNDWARSLAVPLDPLAAIPLVETGRVRKFDAIAVTGDESLRILNAVTGGFAGEVTGHLSNERKAAWGPLAYLREAGVVAAHPPRWTLTISFDGGPPLTLDAINVVVANGRTAGGGILIAPTAAPDDGRLDVLIVRAADAIDRTVITARLLAGDYDRDETVLHRRAHRFDLQTVPPMPFSFDGEPAECSRLHFQVEPAALRFVAGPGFRPRHRGRIAGLLDPVFGLFAGALRLFGRTRLTPTSLLLPLLLLLVLIAVIIVRDRFQPFDDDALRWVHANASPPLTQLAIGLTKLGDTTGTTIISVAAVLWLARLRRNLDAAALALIMIAATGTSRILKEIFQVARPDVFVSPWPADGFSFPSGHAVAAVALYGTLATLWCRAHRRRRWPVLLAAALLVIGILWSRVYLGVHRPSEVLAGALLGATWCSLGLAPRRRSPSDAFLQRETLQRGE